MSAFLIALLAIGQHVVTIQPTVVNPNQWSYYDVYRAPACMKIDGVMSDKEWGKAPVAGGFTECFQAGYAPVYSTTAKMLWDDEYLYLAFDCEDKDVLNKYTKFDDPVFAEDAVEIFIDPDWTEHHYWEIDVSPRNIAVDLNVTAAGWQGRYAIYAKYNVLGLRTGAKVYGTLDNHEDTDKGWTVEFAIPWIDFKGRARNSPPVDGDSWRVNLFRCERVGPGVEDDQFLAWSLSPGVYHQPKNFGVIVFHGRRL